jgi:hypothetical protein
MANNLIEKYSISEKDLYGISLIINKQNQSNFFAKERLKGKVLAILEPYSVSLVDLGRLIKEIEGNYYHTDQELIEKYADVNQDVLKLQTPRKYFLYVGVASLLLVLLAITPFLDLKVEPTVESTIKCIQGSRWTYPDKESPASWWVFEHDGSFRSGTRAFGGMTAEGKWGVPSPGVIYVEYSLSSEGYLPNSQTLELKDCTFLMTGSTRYVKAYP